jgi:predicted dehydrogenase
MKNIKNIYIILIISLYAYSVQSQNVQDKPVRIAVAGMTHGHVSFILNRADKTDIVLAGVYEPNREMAERYARLYHFDSKLIYNDLEKMLDEVKPEAVSAFGSIYEHMAVVEACAPRGIHVMVEKPLATNLAHALRMQELANKYNIHLLTNYETSWYPTTAKSYQLVNDSNYVGSLRKVVVHDGHQGPKEIGCNKEFLEWLTDPVQNGGGALIDFGCYGANLMTYLTRGGKPISVTAVTRNFKPETYPEVDDDATIIVSYPGSICIIQASWNWPFNRKDMEIYGENGYVIAENSNDMRLRNRESNGEQRIQVTPNDIDVYEEPFKYFKDIIRGKIALNDYDPYSLSNNVMVVRILDAARESAKTGKVVVLKYEP